MDELRSRIAQLVGEASTLFGPGVGVFETERAIDIVDRIMKEFPKPEPPLEVSPERKEAINS